MGIPLFESEEWIFTYLLMSSPLSNQYVGVWRFSRERGGKTKTKITLPCFFSKMTVWVVQVDMECVLATSPPRRTQNVLQAITQQRS